MEKLNEIPTTWEWTGIQNIGDTYAGGTPKTSESSNFDGDIPWITPSDLTGYTARYISKGKRNITEKGLATSSAKLMPKGTVLFSSRAPIGYVAIASEELCTNQGFKSINPGIGIDSEFIYYYLKSSKELAESKASGTTFKEISGSRFAKLPIPLAPSNEQKRIVDKIERLFSALDEGEALLKTVQKQLATYRQSVLKSAVTGELTQAWRKKNKHRLSSGEDLLQRILKSRRENWKGRGKYKEPKTPDTSKLPDLPDGWVWVHLDSVILEIITGPFGSTLHKSDYIQNGIPLINPINIHDEKIVPNPNVSIDVNTQKRLERFKVKLGDVIMGRRGEMGRCAPISENEEGWLCGTGSLILRPAKAIDSIYLSMFITSSQTRHYLERNCVGTTMKNLNQKVLNSIILAVPCLEEQREVIDRIKDLFSQIDALEDWCATELSRSGTLRQSILKDAFSGKLVPQNPADEPASELLKRIQAERDKQPKPKTRKGKKKVNAS